MKTLYGFLFWLGIFIILLWGYILLNFKYADNGTARKYSGVKDYFDVAKEAIKEMYRQVGDLVVDEHGVALRGVLVRHLVLPNGLAGTKM